MVIQNPLEIKEKIISIIRRRGPSLPIHIAKEIGISMLFSSAFLSELLSEKRIKISNMKVGNSPLYLTPGQEFLLERFSEHLKSKEKEAFLLLKEKKFLDDRNQEPAIRVALREIRDFAVPFKERESGEIFWRYFTHPETEIIQQISKPQKIIRIEEAAEVEVADREEKKEEREILKKITKPRKIRKKEKADEFFNKVKDFLQKKSIEISGIEGFGRKEVILKINTEGKEKLLIAFDKKRVNEDDLIKAHKKASELNLPYIILSLGGAPKKFDNLIEAVKKLERIEKMSG